MSGVTDELDDKQLLERTQDVTVELMRLFLKKNTTVLDAIRGMSVLIAQLYSSPLTRDQIGSSFEEHLAASRQLYELFVERAAKKVPL